MISAPEAKEMIKQRVVERASIIAAEELAYSKAPRPILKAPFSTDCSPFDDGLELVAPAPLEKTDLAREVALIGSHRNVQRN